MAVFKHWHPVLPGVDLREKPVGVRLAGRDLVLFRDQIGHPAALEDCCPHRRMRLSLGQVCEGRLQCAYHGWTFDAAGQGESPGTPKLRALAPGYDTAEAHGLIWVRALGSSQPLPALDPAGGVWAGLVGHRVRAPLELVLDNFTEIEHTAMVHTTFGFPLERMAEVTCCFEATETEVRTITSGPSKSPGLLLSLLLGVNRQFHFHSHWTTRFSPPHTVVDHYWFHPRSRREGLVRWRFFHFFVPLDERETRIWTAAYVRTRYPLPGGGVPLMRWLMRRKMIEEIDQDKFILENLADQNVAIDGLKLSRFDRPLALNRERLARVYRGEAHDKASGAVFLREAG